MLREHSGWTGPKSTLLAVQGRSGYSLYRPSRVFGIVLNTIISKSMFDQSKVVLIACLAAFACLLDNFLPSMAGEPTIYRQVNEAPQPVRFPLHKPLILVRPVPPTSGQMKALKRIHQAPVPPSDFSVLMGNMSNQIRKEWKAHIGKKEHLVARFKVQKDGAVSDVSVTRSSDNQATDEDAVRAIKRASPFMPLPKYCDSPADIEYTFDDRFASDDSLSRRNVPEFDTLNKEIVR